MRSIQAVLWIAPAFVLLSSCQKDVSSAYDPPSTLKELLPGTRWVKLETNAGSGEELVFRCNDSLWIVNADQQDTFRVALVYESAPSYYVHFYDGQTWTTWDITYYPGISKNCIILQFRSSPPDPKEVPFKRGEYEPRERITCG